MPAAARGPLSTHKYGESVAGEMGNKDSKTAKEGDKTEADKENEDLLEAVASLPKVVPLKSVKRPKGPKGRKPPSRNFLQAIVSYFQVKPQTTSHNSKEVEIVTKEPEVVLDLNVVEKAAVLENVTKGRPAPPGNRRRPARVRNTKPKETIEVEVEAKDEESIEPENTNIKKRNKSFPEAAKQNSIQMESYWYYNRTSI